MPELPVNSKDFRDFDLVQLNVACQHLKVNGYIFDCELSASGNDGVPGCLSWRCKHVEGAFELICYDLNNI